jgi:hypothetical protein
MQPELVINTNKKTYKRMYYVGLVWFFILLCLVFYLNRSHQPGYLSTVLLGLLLLCLAGTVAYLFYAAYRFNRKSPMAIINQEGIWVKQFGVIPWSNIRAIERPIINGMQIEALGIQVKDTQLLSKQASIPGKLIILESKILKCSTIVMDNIELRFDEIADFANQFMDE